MRVRFEGSMTDNDPCAEPIPKAQRISQTTPRMMNAPMMVNPMMGGVFNPAMAAAAGMGMNPYAAGFNPMAAAAARGGYMGGFDGGMMGMRGAGRGGMSMRGGTGQSPQYMNRMGRGGSMGGGGKNMNNCNISPH